MTDLIDAWTVSGKQWGLSYDFRVRLFHDGDVHPTDYDCYSPEDFAAWLRDDWRFVTVEVDPVDEFGAVYESARDSLGAVEWGSRAEVTIDRERLQEWHIKDMAIEAAASADEIRKKIVASV